MNIENIPQYRNINGFPSYRVGDDGSVWSSYSMKWKRLKANKDKDGYLMVALYLNGTRFARKIHRLVLESFVGPCPEGFEAAHNNGLRDDNRQSNLRWATPAENHSDKKKHGTYIIGDAHHASRISDSQVIEIKNLALLGVAKIKIAKLVGVGEGSVHRIIRGTQRVKQ